MEPNNIHSILRKMDSSIELVSNKIAEADQLSKEGYKAKPRKLLIDALEDVEKTTDIISNYKKNGGNLDNFSIKSRVKEYLYIMSELGEEWKKKDFVSLVRTQINISNSFKGV